MFMVAFYETAFHVVKQVGFVPRQRAFELFGSLSHLSSLSLESSHSLLSPLKDISLYLYPCN